MKYLIPLFLLSFGSASAQYYQDEEKEQVSAQGGVAAVSYRIVSPVEYFDLKCGAPKYAVFGNGSADLKAAVAKSVEELTNSGEYAPNGSFSLVFKVEKDGRLSEVEIFPKVQDSKYLGSDISALMKKNMPRLQPASCSGDTVASKFRIRLNFDSDTVDF